MTTLVQGYTDACKALGDHTPLPQLLASLQQADDQANKAGGAVTLKLPAKGSLQPTETGYTLSSVDLQALCSTLGKALTTQIKCLSLRNLGIGNDDCLMLKNFLMESSTLEELDLSGTDIDGSGLAVLAEGLALSKSLATLNLRNVKIGGSSSFPQLISALERNSAITSIDVGNTDLNIDNWIQFINLLSNNTTVKSINLDRPMTRVGHQEMTPHVADLIRRNSTLETLSIKKIACSDEGAAEIAAALCENKSLVHLDLSNNKIGRDGAARLSVALQANNMIESLNLDHNIIEDEGVLSIMSALLEKNTHTLQFLGVAHNNILGSLAHKTGHLYHSGLGFLAESAPSIKTLTSLHLWGNPAVSGVGQLDLEAIKHIAKLVESGTYETDVSVYYVDGVPYLASI